MDSRFTLTRFYTGYTPYQEGWDLASLGFSPAYVSAITALDPRALKFPNINVSGQSALGGVNTYNEQFYNTYEWRVNLTNMVGGHTLRYGAGYRIYQLNQFDLGNSSGNLAADSTYTNGPYQHLRCGADRAGHGQFPVRDSLAQQQFPRFPRPISRYRTNTGRSTCRTTGS